MTFLQPKQLRPGSRLLFSYAPVTPESNVIEGLIVDWSPSGSFVQIEVDQEHRRWNRVDKIAVVEVLSAEDNDR